MYPILNLIIVNVWAIIDKVCARGTCVPVPEDKRADKPARMANGMNRKVAARNHRHMRPTPVISGDYVRQSDDGAHARRMKKQ